MTKFFALLLAVVGFILLGLGLVLTREHPAMLVLGIVGAIITYFAYSMDSRREKAVAAQHRKAIEHRIETLAKTPWENGNTLEVNTGSGKIWIALLTLVASVLFAYSSASGTEPQWGIFAGSVLFSILALFALFRLLPGIGKPVLVLSKHGFTTPLHGIIRWAEVSGVHLQEITLRGSTTSTLIFKVERYGESAESIHWTEQVLAAFGLGALKRKVVAVLLNGATEKPETIYAIAKLLWQQNTGMNHEWNPMLSDEFNQAARRAHEFMERHKAPNSFTTEVFSDPSKALDEIEQFRRDMGTVNSERRRAISKINWMVALSVFGIVGSLLWPVVKRLI